MPKMDIRIAVVSNSVRDWDCYPVHGDDEDAFQSIEFSESVTGRTTRTVVTASVDVPDEVSVVNVGICATAPDVATKIRALADIFASIRGDLSPDHDRVLQDLIGLIPEADDDQGADGVA